jgi:soluble lytic murein transglycosylase-like protein
MGLHRLILLIVAAALPPPDGPLPRDAPGVAAQLAYVRPALRHAATAWDGRGTPPEPVTLLALREQRLTLRLADHPSLIRPTLRALPAAERGAVRDEVAAERALSRLSAGWPVKHRFRTGAPAPAGRLWSFYGAAHRRFGVSRSLLAAVNLVESQFGRLRSDSVSGAQGPMQFMPATWAAYGLGGDVQRPRDAILGAANYLHANGAPADDARALAHYNPSRLYVDAVSRYARRMRSAAAFRAYYARQVFVRGAGHRRRRITGP